MQSFEWVDATSVEQAAELLGRTNPRAPVLAKAGGLDLLDLMKEGILTPARLVNLKSIPGLDDVHFDQRAGLALGALVTLARIAADPDVARVYPALAGAASHAATPQIRSAATIGGNLLQRPRSWYFRSEYFHQLEARGGPDTGDGRYEAIFDNGGNALVHASTPATALVAYGASVELVRTGGRTRTVPVADLLLPPDRSRDRDAAIGPDEVLTRVLLPAPAPGARAAYHKQTERESYDWPICDVAVVLELEDAVVRRATIVLGWVAPTPRRATESESRLVGHRVDPNVAREAARAAVLGATPLAGNHYKVPVLETVVRRTILEAAGLDPLLSL